MAVAEKLDLYRRHKAEYAARAVPQLIRIGRAKYLAIEGAGDPADARFTAAVGALYGCAFTIKMTRKFAGKGDYKVAHLEGLWWTPRKADTMFDVPKDQWRWQMMIRVPEFIRPSDLKAAKEQLLKKGKGKEVSQVTLEEIDEGLCVQAMHVGPYSDEPRTIAAMREVAKRDGYTPHMRHHEIYLNDPRRVKPEKCKTILRQPVT